MPRLFYLLLAGILLFSSCNLKAPEDPLSVRVEQVKAMKDFILFRQILEQAHPALTEYISKKRLNFVFDSVSETIKAPITLRGFYNKLSFIVDEIGCSHTYTSLPQYAVDSLFNRTLFFPFPVIYIDGSLISNSDFEVPHGTKILSVNSIPVKRLLDSLMMYNSVEGFHRETQKYLTSSDFSYDYFVRFGGFKKFELLIKDTSGRIKTIYPQSVSLTEVNERRQHRFYYDATDVPYFLRVVNDNNYALLRLTSFEFDSGNQQQAFENFLSNSFELLANKPNIKTLVIDLRENTGGDLYNCFLLNSYISKVPFAEYKSVSTRITKIPFEEYLSKDFDSDMLESIDTRLKEEFTRFNKNRYQLQDSLIGQWTTSANRFTKHVIIITNYKTVSSASYFTLLARHTAGARVIGYETSGGDFSGNGFATLKYTLPATGIGFQFAYANLLYSYGAEKPGRGIIPDYLVQDDYKSFKGNKDQQINYIVDSLIIK